MPKGSSTTDGRGRASRRFLRGLVLAVVAVNLMVVGSVTLVLAHRKVQERAQAEVTTQTLARVLEENLTGFITKIDLTLLAVRDELSRQTAAGSIDKPALEQVLARHDARLPEALGLRVVDAQGIIRYAVAEVAVSQASIADRPQFIEMRDNPQAGLVISKPVFGRAAQQWVITLSRRVDNADGSFGGDVHVAVALDRFTKVFAAVDLGAQGSVSLWDAGPTMIARYAATTGIRQEVGGVTPSPELMAVIGTNQDVGQYYARSRADGVVRTFAVRRLGALPLFLTVGIAEEDYLADWCKEVRELGGLSLLFLLATNLSAWLVFRSWRHRETYTQAILRAKEEVEAERRLNASLLSSAGEGICGTDAQGRLTFVNSVARQMLGWSDNDGLAQSLHELVHHHHLDASVYPECDCPAYKTLRDGVTRHVTDDVYWRKDGSWFSVEFTSAAILDDHRVVGSVTVFRDITAGKATERRLRFFKEVLDHAKDPVQCIDPEDGFRVILTNAAAEAHFGLPMDYLLTMRVPEWDPGFCEMTARAMRAKLADNETIVFETEHRTQRGLVPVEIKLTAAEVDGHLYWIAIVRDISERKHTEAQMARHLAGTEALSAILRLSLESLPLDRMLEVALEEVLALPWLQLEQRGAVFLADGDNGTLRMAAQRNLPPEIQDRCASVALGHCLCGRAASLGQVVFANCLDGCHEVTFDGMAEHGHYCVPIGNGAEVVGVLNVYVSPGHQRSDEEEAFLRLVADTLAGIIGRRHAEDSLRASEELARTLMNASGDAAFLMDRDGVILAANETMAARFHTSIDGLVGRPLFERVSSDLAVSRLAQCQEVIRTGKPICSQDERDGLRLDNRLYPIHGVGGEVSQIAAFSRDVTEEHRREREIRELLSYQRAILENTPIGIGIVSMDRRFIQANEAFGRIFGCHDRDLVGRDARILYADDAQYGVIGERGYPLIQAGEVFDEEVPMVRRDGAEVWVRLVAHRVDMADPSLGAVWAAEDITARKALELDFKRSNEELERFAYVASHDLRQPLRVISSYLSLIERKLRSRLDDEEKTFIDFAVDGAKRMDRMIIDLLDYSRIGRKSTDRQPVALDVVLARAIGNLEFLIKDSQAEIVVASELLTLPGYESELERLFQNLISNAVKFRTAERPPKVTISCRETSRDCIIAVSDNGIGIAPKDYDRLFVVFQRLVSREQYEGNGIGLAACRKIAEHHGGRIWVESELGKGSTFLIALPVRDPTTASVPA
jgi:PAS domain S-box-containing protein